VGEIYQYRPKLADKVELNSSLGIEELARRFSGAVKDKSA
jgi:hypothetical protein